MADKPDSNRSPALKRAVLALDSLQSRLDAIERKRTEPIAIVGIGCRFPGGANDPDSYWQMLKEGVDAIGDLPEDRWKWSDYPGHSPDVPGMEAIRWGGYLDNIDRFDAAFFGIAPREAAKMDPQQRLFLEVAWEALENAGQAPDRLAGSRTSVFAGVCTSDFADLQTRSGLHQIDPHYASGIGESIVTGRLSYLLGLVGPSVSLDTACSSSLVAVHLACQSLRNGESDMSIAGGVNVILLPNNVIAFNHSGMLAADGRCKTFDAKADGFVRAEGCGLVVLKRLSDAVEHGDPIYALVRGSAVNQDGASSGLTAPNGPSQQAVVRSALAAANIEPGRVGYVEAHGTGTPLGDPIEVQALAAVLASGRSKSNPLRIGSAKTNFGHLEAAAGIAGLIKVALSLKHRAIPPHLHFSEPSPHIPWANWPLEVPDRLIPWTNGAQSLVAGVSSFGFGGTNAHVVLEEAPSIDVAITHRRPLHLLRLAAKSPAALRNSATIHARHLRASPDENVAALCYTLNTGRAVLPHRAVAIGESRADIARRLEAFGDGTPGHGIRSGHVPSSEPPGVAFLFTGQGAQYRGMARELYGSQPVFRQYIDQCHELLSSSFEVPLLSILFGEDSGGQTINETRCAQPALFAVEYALANLWQSWGIRPTVVMGHSVGELAAACFAGSFDLEDGLRLIAERGRLMQSLPSGGEMAAVFADEATVAEAITGSGSEIAIAAINEPGNTVVSGAASQVGPLLEQLGRDGIQSQRLVVSHAFHSPLMNPIIEAFCKFAAALTVRPTKIDLVSNVTGDIVPAGSMLDADYWSSHILRPVRFRDAVAAMARRRLKVFLEVGPHPTLLAMARNCLPDETKVWLPSLRRGTGDWAQMLDSVAGLHLAGCDVDWNAFHADSPARRLCLPTYPFERIRHWIDDTPSNAIPRPGIDGLSHPLLHNCLRSPVIQEIVYESYLHSGSPSYLGEHRVFDTIVLPATAYIEMVFAAARHAFGVNARVIEDFEILEALIVPEEETKRVQLIFTPQPDGGYRFQLISLSGVDAIAASIHRRHASGIVRVAQGSTRQTGLTGDIDRIRERCGTEFPLVQFYEHLSDRGIRLGSQFRNLQVLRTGSRECLGLATLGTGESGYLVHPTLLDACLQAITAVAYTPQSFATGDTVFMPFAIGSLRMWGDARDSLWSHVELQGEAGPDKETVAVDVTTFDLEGRPVLELRALQLRRATSFSLRQATRVDYQDWLYRIDWQRAVPAVAASRAPSFEFPSAIAETAMEHTGSLSAEVRLGDYDEWLPAIDRLCNAYIWQAFNELGWPFAKGDRFELDTLANRLGVAARHRRLLARLLDILAEDGQLVCEEGLWRVIGMPVAADLGRVHDETRQRLRDVPAELEFAERGGTHLAQALSDRCDPLTVLFPNGSFDLAHRLYRESPAARVLNGLARIALQEMTRSQKEERPLRILEIGAGTGGTAACLLPELQDCCEQYVFTDLSEAFLNRAREEFDRFPFVRYEILDIEKDPISQGFEPHSFDVIVAANVIHATADIRNALTHVRRLLAPCGMLMLLEGTRPQRWIDLTFGLTNGWWRFTDTDLRPAYALMPPKRWKEILAEMSFGELAVVPESSESAALEQNVLILARGPDVAPEASVDSSWIAFCTQDDIGDQLANRLEQDGERVIRVHPGSRYGEQRGRFEIDPGSKTDYERLLTECFALPDAACRGIVHTWSLASDDAERASEVDPGTAQERGCKSALALLQSVVSTPGFVAPPIFLVTRGARGVAGSAAPGFAHATLWGLANVFALEHPDARCKCIDLDPARPETDLESLYADVLQNDRETQVAFRRGLRLVARLARRRKRHAVAAKTRLDDERLVVPRSGVLDDLRFEPRERAQPEAGHIQIRVRATGMNFRDVLIALGMYPEPVSVLGGECAGIVTAVGEGVRDYALGDAVVAIAPDSFRKFVCADARLTAAKPEGLSFEEAVTLPSAFTTAIHALTVLGRLSQGDRVLIHAAAGGVGQAALQIARNAGSEIYATAGSVDKRRYLRSLGVARVMNSRSLDFKDEIMAATGGAGVDIVLNCLSDDFVDASFAVLARNGRFLEIGKRGIWDPRKAASMRPDAEYHIVDLSATAVEHPDRLGSLLRQVMSAAADGKIAPLPLQAFEHTEIIHAFRYMANANHIGKIAISRSSASALLAGTEAARGGTVLITGGLGGLGMAIAEWLVARGVKSIVLMGRSAPDEQARTTISALNESGATVVVSQGDVSMPSDVERVLQEINDRLPPLAGIIHAAGVLDDGVLVRQSWPRFASVMAPKVLGAWNLHLATRDLPLDFFVLFSSISSVLGSRGQSNHAAANAFLDALAHHRRHSGLAAQSINWGVWSQIGAAASHNVAERVGARGMGSFAPEQGLAIFEELARDDDTQVAVMPVDWPRFGPETWPDGMPAYLENVAQTPAARSGDTQADQPFAGTLLDELGATPANLHQQVILGRVRGLAAHALGYREGQPLDDNQPLQELGLDSLMAVELRNALAAGMGRSTTLPATLVFDYPTVADLARYVAGKVGVTGKGPEEAALPSGQKSAMQALERIESLSDDELEKYLAERAGAEA